MNLEEDEEELQKRKSCVCVVVLTEFRVLLEVFQQRLDQIPAGQKDQNGAIVAQIANVRKQRLQKQDERWFRRRGEVPFTSISSKERTFSLS